MRLGIALSILCLGLLAIGCKEEITEPKALDQIRPTAGNEAAALPNGGFKAEVTLPDPPVKLRAGQKETIQVRIKNLSEVIWYPRGGEINRHLDNKFYMAAGNRWLKADDSSLVTNMDGRHGLRERVEPGQETEVALQITAPKEPGEYFLEVDVIQEQVAWFSDKGSVPARAKISVVK